MARYCGPFALVAASSLGLALPRLAAQVPDLHYDFEGVAGTTVLNRGSAGTAFDGTLVTIDRGSSSGAINGNTGGAYTGSFDPVVSSDAKFGSGALQPTNFEDTSPGAMDIGSLGGLMTVPQFDLGTAWTFAVWAKLTENPNQSASNNRTNDSERGKLQTLAANQNLFPFDGFKFFYNEFRFRQNDPGAPRRLKLEGMDGVALASHTTPGNDVPDDGDYHHIALTIDATGTVNSTHMVSEFFVDGVRLPKEEFRFDNIPLSAIGEDYYNQPLSIGAQNQPIEPFFAYGVLDEVRFYANTILTDEQIAALANPGTTGDFNGDGLVDAADYTVWRDNLGAADESSINSNGDGQNGVDQADYDVWSNSFSVASAGAQATVASIPEPGSFMLGLFAGMALLSCRASVQRRVSRSSD